ncbi:AEC family transporter [Acinetobacter bohemicus]|uniref:AEC family transporter n=1 Tax=Acinetobacter TaxID=469 RepID=UPI00209BAAF0|nr:MULTISPECIES: AEC family transporter [Acinetobacter]MCO8042629.1 AEC family transporter [Acinetobacter sp. S4400-12]MCU7224981.1 AEC family transporter [Acinetobacter bohemicus]
MIFSVIVPIFLLVGLGYLSVKCQILKKEQVDTVGAFVIKVALPLLFFQVLSSKDLHEIWYFEYFMVYSTVTLVLYVTGFWIMRRHFQNSFSHSAILSLGAAMSNTGLIGTAMLTLLVGSQALTYTSLVVIIESMLLLPMVLVLAAMGSQQQSNLGGILKSTILPLFKNPLFVGVILGISCAVFEIRVPVYLDQVFAMIGQTASPLALFVIGGGIVGTSLKYVNVESCYLVFSSNILMPLLMYLGLSQLTSLSQEMIYAGTLIAALPMPTLYGMLGQAYGLKERTLTPLLMSTIAGFIVASGLITLWWS